MNKYLIVLYLLAAVASSTANAQAGSTKITKWQGNKTGAVSITYDDGNLNQFKVALPIMEDLKLPATFYVITGGISGSKYPPKFIGRSVEDIIKESIEVPANAANYFERASAAKYLGRTGAFAYYDKSAGLFERNQFEKAYRVMDSLYKDVRSGLLKPGAEHSMEISGEKGLSWDSIKEYASKGYEFSSHTITHTHLAVLDSINIDYELSKSKEDLKSHLGDKYTLDAEIPFGVENPRAMKYALPYYGALRNLMTDSFMHEINRGYKEPPGLSDKQYVQWQRGPLSNTSMELMKSWVDTALIYDKIWLVLVFHGVDGFGWEPLTGNQLREYFQYIKDHEDKLWVATFGDVVRYLRERQHASVHASFRDHKIEVNFTCSMDTIQYNLPLTLKTYIPLSWQKVLQKQGGGETHLLDIQSDEKGHFVLYQAKPNLSSIELSAQ